MKVARGDVKVSNVFDWASWNPQELLSLIVTAILVLFFINNLLMDQWNIWKKH